MYVDKGAEVNLMKRGCGHAWDRKGGVAGAVTNGISLSGGQAGAWGTPLVRLCRGGTGAKRLGEREREDVWSFSSSALRVNMKPVVAN